MPNPGKPVEPTADSTSAPGFAGRSSSAYTIVQMYALSDAGAMDPEVQRIARELSCRPDAIAAIHAYVQRVIEYASDAAIELAWSIALFPELLIPPALMVRSLHPVGDCDEFSMLVRALILAAGLGDPIFRTIAADPNAPADDSHVYVVVGGRVVDASHGPYVGWEARPGAVTRFGTTVKYVGNRTDWARPGGSRLNGVGTLRRLGGRGGGVGSIWDTIATTGGRIAENVVPRLVTPDGYYRQIGPGGTSIETRQTGGAGSLSLSNLGGGSTFPWAWLAGAALLILVVKSSSGGRRG